MAMERTFCAVLCLVLCTFHCGAFALENAPGFGSARHVLVLGVDGLGGDYLHSAERTPNIHKLMQSGSSTLTARDALPTVSLPNWGSILTGASPETSGIDSNSWYNPYNCLSYYHVYAPECIVCHRCISAVDVSFGIVKSDPDLLPVVQEALTNKLERECLAAADQQRCNDTIAAVLDDVFSFEGEMFPSRTSCTNLTLCRQQISPLGSDGAVASMFATFKQQWPLGKTAAFTDWLGINQLIEPGVVDFFEFKNDGPPRRSQTLANDMVEIVTKFEPNLAFIHFDDVDEAGHEHGWGSPEQWGAIKSVDDEIGLIVAAYEDTGIIDDTLILLIADHGGQNFTHGYSDQINVAIPWIAVGPGVEQNYSIESYVRDVDIAPTALWSLGVTPPATADGRVNYELWSGIPYKSPSAPNPALAQRALIIVVSGLNSHGVLQSSTPSMDALSAAGASTMFARAQMPASSLSNFASIVMGAGPEETGICRANALLPAAHSCRWRAPPEKNILPPISGEGSLFPSIFDVVSERFASSSGTAAFLRTERLGAVLNSSSVDTMITNATDAELVQSLLETLQSSRPPTLAVLQLNDVQESGIRNGFNSAAYATTVEATDTLLGSILDGAWCAAVSTDHVLTPTQVVDDITMVVVTSDHGGFNHTLAVLDDSTYVIPFWAAGAGLRQGPITIDSSPTFPSASHTRNLDAASMALYALGVDQPTYWIGSNHADLFENPLS